MFGKLIIEDLEVQIENTQRKVSSPFNFGFQGFTLHFEFLSNSINEISVLNFFNKLLIRLNPNKDFRFYLKSEHLSTKGPFDLNWILAYDQNLKESGFWSKLKIGKKNLPIQVKNKPSTSFGFTFDYDLSFNQIKNEIALRYFRILFANETWLDLKGNISDVNSPDLKYHFTIQRSFINLRTLNRYLSYWIRLFSPESPPIQMRGALNFKKLDITGDRKQLKILGSYQILKLAFSQAKSAVKIPSYVIHWAANINLKEKLIWDKIKNLSLSMKGVINQGRVNMGLALLPFQKVKLKWLIRGFVLDNLHPDLRGNFNLDWRASGKNIQSLHSKMLISLSRLRYLIDRSESGLNKINMKLNQKFNFQNKKLTQGEINSALELLIKNSAQKDALSLNLGSKIKLSPRSTLLKTNVRNLTIFPPELYPTLTNAHKELIQNFRNKIKSVTLKGQTKINQNQEGEQKRTYIEHQTNMFIPSLGIKDLRLDLNIQDHFDRTRIKYLKFSGLKKSLALSLSGMLKKKKTGVVPDLVFKLNFNQPQTKTIFEGNQFKGLFKVKAKAKSDRVSGYLKIKDFSYEAKGLVKIDTLSLDFPFTHYLSSPPSAQISETSDTLALPKSFSDKESKYNLTMRSIQIPHPQRPKETFTLAYTKDTNQAVESLMRYKNNQLEVPWLQIQTLNGLFLIQDLYFYIGDSQPRNMIYAGKFVLKDIDFKQLLPPDKTENIEDASIRLDGLFEGDRLDHPLESINARVSVHKIGSQFGKSVLKVAASEYSDYLENIINVNKIDFEIQEGIIYTRILYTLGFLGRLFNPRSPSGDHIEQSRLPLSEFIQRADHEISTYYVEKDDQK